MVSALTKRLLLEEKPSVARSIKSIANRHTGFLHPTIAPRGTLIADQRRAGEARPRGKAGSERRKACFHPGGSGFLLPRGTKQQCRLPDLFQQLSRPQYRFFGTFLTQESTVIPVSPLVSPHQNAPGRISAGRNEFALEAAVEGAALTAYARSPRGRTDRPCRPP